MAKITLPSEEIEIVESIIAEPIDVDATDTDSTPLSINAKQREIRRRIEDAIEARKIKEELGFDLY